jgi:hypothetical protein
MVQVLRLITFLLIYQGNFTLNPLINALSDHNTQLLKLRNITAPIQEFTSCHVRDINSFTIDEVQSKLSTESWEDIFEGPDKNVTVNNFLNIYLKFFLCMFH